MKKRKYSIVAFIIACMFWFLDASIHYFVYGEPQFEFIPDDINEFWMRTVIVLLVILFGIYADYSTRKLLIKEKQLEATRIYDSMIYASQHILNNLLNQMQLFKLEALKSDDFDREIIDLYDSAIDEATDLIQKLSQVENITDENIWASVDPAYLAKSSNKTNPADAKNRAAD
ncbi:MAG: putative membrane protein [Planctomycetota bacterium]|jgi:uncharacterized membrane protein